MGLLHLVISTLSNYGRQLLFAIAPIPAYLPQYYTLCNTNDPVLQRRKQRTHQFLLQSSTSSSPSKTGINDSGSNNANVNASNNNINGVTNTNLTNVNVKSNPNGSDGGLGGGGGGTANNMNNNNSVAAGVGVGGTSKPITEGGFSSTSIMILLLSHAFRLQYFFISAIISTFYQTDDDNDDNIKNGGGGDGSHNSNHKKVDRVHFDLVMQSFVMIGIQLLLLSAVTRRKRLSIKKKKDDYDDGVYEHDTPISMTAGTSSATLTSSSSSTLPSMTSSTNISSRPTMQRRMSVSSSSSLPRSPFIWVYKPNQHWRWDTVHQHVELIVLVVVLESFLCRYFIYPNNAMDYIKAVKNISVLLESCLALPQMILNYKRKSTDGLSLLMVVGWVLGDLLKLAYFIASYNNNGDNVVGDGMVVGNQNSVVMPHNGNSSSSDLIAFMVGSVFALVLDSIVVLQLIKWYPTNEFKNLKKQIKHSRLLRYFRRCTRAGKSTRTYSCDELMP